MARYSNQKRAKRAGSSNVIPLFKNAAGSNPMSDVKQRKEKINSAILELDPEQFAEDLGAWLEATSFLRSQAEATRNSTAAPSAILPLSSSDLALPAVRGVADDAVFAFCILAALNANAAAAEKLESALLQQFGEAFPGAEALGVCLKGNAAGDPLDEAIGPFIKAMLEEKALDPRDVWNMGLRLLEKVRKSNFVQELMVILAKWHRDRWTQIITQQLFNLTRPRATVPPIEDVLRDDRNDQCFIACLLIASTGAVDLELDETYRAHLQNLAQRD
jgi:hypothetical protein